MKILDERIDVPVWTVVVVALISLDDLLSPFDALAAVRGLLVVLFVLLTARGLLHVVRREGGRR